jgi:hypothetical protein
MAARNLHGRATARHDLPADFLDLARHHSSRRRRAALFKAEIWQELASVRSVHCLHQSVKRIKIGVYVNKDYTPLDEPRHGRSEIRSSEQFEAWSKATTLDRETNVRRLTQ